MNKDYETRLRDQIKQYENVEIHALPEIFHYWSNKYLRPKIEHVFGGANFTKTFAELSAEAFERTGSSRIASLGAGDCYFEIEMAEHLLEMGRTDFVITCLEISDHLRSRARASATEKGIPAQNLEFLDADVNSWLPEEKIGVYLANQSLHHFVELEMIFKNIRSSLIPGGVFLTTDMIGRNGHMRWSEVRLFVEHFWSQLPEKYKYNAQLQRLDSPDFRDHDCSNEGFEGIRAQDILPLLVNNFNFSHFCVWGGVTDIFVDRGYGHNFDASSEDDRAFIDRVENLNEALLQSGFIKPTSIMAAMVIEPTKPKCNNGITPELCVRSPSESVMKAVCNKLTKWD